MNKLRQWWATMVRWAYWRLQARYRDEEWAYGMIAKRRMEEVSYTVNVGCAGSYSQAHADELVARARDEVKRRLARDLEDRMVLTEYVYPDATGGGRIITARIVTLKKGSGK